MRWTTSAFVALFVVADLGVLGGAYRLTHRGPDLVSDSSSSARTATASTSGADEPGPGWSGPLSLAAFDSGELARVTRGSCDSRAPVRARAWVARSFEAPLREVTVPGLQESLGVRVDDGGTVRIVGLGPACRPFGFASTDGGRTWRRGAVPDGVWYLDPDTTAQTVHGPVPGGTRSVGCIPVGVATTAGGDALVSCQADSVYRLRAGQSRLPGPSDSFVVPSPTAAVVAASGPLALTGSPDCAAALEAMVPGGPGETLACLGRDEAPLGLAASGRRVFAQVGYRLLYSTDGGRDFTRYPGDSG